MPSRGTEGAAEMESSPIIAVVAQLVEHGTENPGVAGSMPANSTRIRVR